MPFKLSILGSNSAIPTIHRFTTSQVLHCNNKNYVIDCGEGIQMRIQDLKIKKNKISEVFISHLHGDHFFGLPGLLTSFNLSGREKELTIFGPVGIQKFVDTLKELGCFNLNFPLKVLELTLSKKTLIFEDENVFVYGIPLKHRIPTHGFIFWEKEKPINVRPEFIGKYNLNIEEIKALKLRKDVLRKDGSVLKYKELTLELQPPVSYAFISDTLYDKELIPLLEGVKYLYHESTYLEALKDKAFERMHSTAKDAAKIAHLCGVHQLFLGHFSSRYKDISVFKAEANEIFDSVILAKDGEEYSLK